MTWEIGINIAICLIGIIGAVAGWWLKTLWALMHAMQREQAAFAIHIAQTCVVKSELHSSLEGIFKLLHRIEDKLDRKVDKS